MIAIAIGQSQCRQPGGGGGALGVGVKSAGRGGAGGQKQVKEEHDRNRDRPEPVPPAGRRRGRLGRRLVPGRWRCDLLTHVSSLCSPVCPVFEAPPSPDRSIRLLVSTLTANGHGTLRNQ